MGRRSVRNYREEEARTPDCSTCIRKETCDRRAENSFCTKWAGSEPEPKGEDPNLAWLRGEQADF